MLPFIVAVVLSSCTAVVSAFAGLVEDKAAAVPTEDKAQASALQPGSQLSALCAAADDASAVAAALNTNFTRGGNNNRPETGTGVMVTLFNVQPGVLKPYLPSCAPDDEFCNAFSDRIAATVLNAKAPKGRDDKIPTYHDTSPTALIGFVLNPAHTLINCAYAADGGSAVKICNPPGRRDDCLPGCQGLRWCEAKVDIAGGICVWRPEDLPHMLQSQRVLQQTGHTQFGRKAGVYNEVVIDAETFRQRMPHIVEAVFSLRVQDGCGVGTPRSCKDYARSVRDTLVTEYGSSHGQRETTTIPLLELDLYNWERPFSASATDADRANCQEQQYE